MRDGGEDISYTKVLSVLIHLQEEKYKFYFHQKHPYFALLNSKVISNGCDKPCFVRTWIVRIILLIGR